MSLLSKLKLVAGDFLACRLYARNWFLMGLRQFLKSRFIIRMWVTTPSGARIWLDNDLIDDIILKHLYEMPELFFPQGIHFKTGDLFLDLGTHHGIYIVEMLVRHPQLKAVCVEPDPWGCELLQKMVERNNLNNRIEIHNCAIGEHEGEAVLVQSDEGSWGNYIAESPEPNSKKVTTRRLSALVNGRSFRVIKCNTEGGEYTIIPQCIELNLQPDLYILMTHGDPQRQESLLRSIEATGFVRKLVNDTPLNPGWHLIRLG